MDRARAGRRGDGAERPHGDGTHVARKKQKLSEVCQKQWEVCQRCVSCQGHPVSTWMGWDSEAKPHFYCYRCWDQFFENETAARRSEVRDLVAGLGDGVPSLSKTLEDLDISGTGGSSSASGSSTASRRIFNISMPKKKTACTRDPATTNVRPTTSLLPIVEHSDLEPMRVVPSDELLGSMEKSRGGVCRIGGAVG